jgi:hypothetical protein
VGKKIIKYANWGWLNPSHVDNCGFLPETSLVPIITRQEFVVGFCRLPHIIDIDESTHSNDIDNGPTTQKNKGLVQEHNSTTVNALLFQKLWRFSLHNSTALNRRCKRNHTQQLPLAPHSTVHSDHFLGFLWEAAQSTDLG